MHARFAAMADRLGIASAHEGINIKALRNFGPLLALNKPASYRLTIWRVPGAITTKPHWLCIEVVG